MIVFIPGVRKLLFWITQVFQMLHYVLLFAGVLAVSTASIFAVLANAPGIAASFWRFLISGIVMGAYYRTFGFRKDVLRYSAIAGLALALHMASWIESLFRASVALSTAIVCTHSIFSGIFASFAGERFRLREVAGIFVALAGIFLLSGADTYAEPAGIVLAFIGAVSGGLYFSLARFSQSVDFRDYVVSTYLMAAVFSGLGAFVLGVSLTGYSAETFFYFVLLAIIPMSFGHTVLNYLIRRMKVVVVTGSVLGEVAGSALLAAIFLGQVLTPLAYLYLLVILVGIYLTTSKS
ncbi:Permease of the drug/metabolite transporter (DMT) superfamily [Geoglobus acetivorans]|uniref:Permease of the drug/metabolite transporter (DMT) superfamily n=2 Tax=Geoglobus acetivorans TaxID=565033 RepID=A0A0A7GBF2_GEOAI|nr:Permease of the drug/metabolite transporter (DMT) superfamily [Geoglobus acetivorans]